MVSKFTPKKFYEIDSRGLYYKTFYGSNCCRIEISFIVQAPAGRLNLFQILWATSNLILPNKQQLCVIIHTCKIIYGLRPML
jgi:hypothetical protein